MRVLHPFIRVIIRLTSRSGACSYPANRDFEGHVGGCGAQPRRDFFYSFVFFSKKKIHRFSRRNVWYIDKNMSISIHKREKLFIGTLTVTITFADAFALWQNKMFFLFSLMAHLSPFFSILFIFSTFFLILSFSSILSILQNYLGQ